MKINGGVITKTTDLVAAQRTLGQGSTSQRQAIIPMTGQSPGDPTMLLKQWVGGSMWWENPNDIHTMQKMCGKAGLPG